MEHILHATDLVMDYSTQQATPNATHMLALNHVDFGIQAGESIAVMGPSGSGNYCTHSPASSPRQPAM